MATADVAAERAHKAGPAPSRPLFQLEPDAFERADDIARQGVSGEPSPFPHLAEIQRSFGGLFDLRTARAHIDPAAVRSSQSLRAQAYTVGSDVAFAEPPSLETAAHEAAHVAQNRGNRAPTCGISRSGDFREAAAETIARRAASGASAADLVSRQSPGNGARIQRQEAPEIGPPTLDQAYQTALADSRATGNWQRTAELLNGFNRQDIESRLVQLSDQEVGYIHQGAVDNEKVGPDSQLAQMTVPGAARASTPEPLVSQGQPATVATPATTSPPPTPGPPQLVQSFWGWVAESNWTEAAETLNGFNTTDIHTLLAQCSNEQIDAIHQGALENQRVGPQSNAALLTGGPSEVSDDAIAKLDKTGKLIAALESALKQAPDAFGDQVQALLQPKALAEFAFFTALFVALQSTPAGWATDLAIIGLEAYLIGPLVFQALSDLIAFYKGATNAVNQTQIKGAGRALADALGILGIALLMKLIFHEGGAKEEVQAPKGGAEIEPGKLTESKMQRPVETDVPSDPSQVKALLEETAGKETLSPAELKSERAVAEGTPGKSINEPPFSVEYDLSNGHVIKETPDGKFCERCSGPCAVYDAKSGELITEDVKNFREGGEAAQLKYRTSEDIGTWGGRTQAARDGLVEANWVNVLDDPSGHGIDDVMIESSSGDTYLVEYKGGESGLKGDQMEQAWVERKVAQMRARGDTVWSKKIQDAAAAGKLKGRAYSTPINPTGAAADTTVLKQWTYAPF
ncbi:MAG: DUF4157 domain-containing protein [Candidatus Cybelea sp.]